VQEGAEGYTAWVERATAAYGPKVLNESGPAGETR